MESIKVRANQRLASALSVLSKLIMQLCYSSLQKVRTLVHRVPASNGSCRVASPEVHNPKTIQGAMVPIRTAKLALKPFPAAWQEKVFATNQTMSPILCLCFSVQTFANRSELGRGGGSSSNGFKRQSQDQMKAKKTHTCSRVLEAKIEIMKLQKKLRVIKLIFTQYKHLYLLRSNIRFLSIKSLSRSLNSQSSFLLNLT